MKAGDHVSTPYGRMRVSEIRTTTVYYQGNREELRVVCCVALDANQPSLYTAPEHCFEEDTDVKQTP